jgi:hypothetical protein
MELEHIRQFSMSIFILFQNQIERKDWGFTGHRALSSQKRANHWQQKFKPPCNINFFESIIPNIVLILDPPFSRE